VLLILLDSLKDNNIYKFLVNKLFII